MSSLRNYANKKSLAYINGMDEVNLTDKLLTQAESLIDTYIADFYEGSFSKWMKETQSFAASQTTFTTISLTISGVSPSSNYYKYTVIELLSGDRAGTIIPVDSSEGGILTFQTITGLTGQIDCKIYQLGKFPMVKDVITSKSIPREVVEALAWQVEFLFKNSKKINKTTKKSESIGENYSYTNEDSANDSISNRMSPLAKDLLSVYYSQTI